MPSQSWVAVLPPSQPSAGAAFNTFTTAADISPTPAITLPANFLVSGSALRWTAFGVFGTTGTPTLAIAVQFGATVLAISGTITTATGLTNAPWRIEGTTHVGVTAGTASPARTQGTLYLGTAVSTVAVSPIPATALATVNIDTTTASKFSVFATWGTSNVANTITCWELLVESLI